MVTTYALIENGVVTNVAVAEGEWPFPGEAVALEPGSHVGIGCGYDGTAFTYPDASPVLPPDTGMDVL